MVCDGRVGLSGLSQPLLRNLSLDLLLGDLLTELLGRVEDVDRVFIIQDVPFGIFEHFKDQIFGLLHLILVLVLGQDEVLVLLI